MITKFIVNNSTFFCGHVQPDATSLSSHSNLRLPVLHSFIRALHLRVFVQAVSLLQLHK